MTRGAQLTAFGRTQTATQWAREHRMTPTTLGRRLGDGWTLERALREPVAPRRTDRRIHNSDVSDIAESRWKRDGSGEMWEGAEVAPYDADHVAQAMIAKHGPFTLEEISAFMGLTRERIRQIEHEALAKMRRTIKRGGG